MADQEIQVGALVGYCIVVIRRTLSLEVLVQDLARTICWENYFILTMCLPTPDIYGCQ